MCRNRKLRLSRHQAARASRFPLYPLLFIATTASAATWEFAPEVLGGYRFSDNYHLDLPGGEIDVSGLEADASLAIRTLDPRTKIEITPRIRSTYFPDDKDEDSNDFFLNAIAEDITPRRRMGVRADVSDETVVRSELPDTDFTGDLGDPTGGDSGRIIQRNRRNYFRIAPYFDYDLTERFRMEFTAKYVDSQYEEQLVGFQQDFSEIEATAGVGYEITPRSDIMFRLLASQYETTFDSNAYGGEAEWATDFTETSRMYVSLGAQNTEDRNGGTDTNVIGGIGGRWTGQRNSLFLDLTRTIGAIGAGTVVERHQLRMKIDHDVSPRFSLLFGLRASRDEDIEEDGTYPTRKYAAADAGFEWRWQRFLAVTATYNYLWQEYADEPSDASSNGFLIGVVYEPKRRD